MDVPDLRGSSLSGLGPASARRPEARTPASHEADSLQRARSRPDAEKEVPRVKAREAPEPPKRTGTRLRVDGATDRVVAQILDEQNRVIKQIPPEELLKIAARFRKLNGLIFDQKA